MGARYQKYRTRFISGYTKARGHYKNARARYKASAFNGTIEFAGGVAAGYFAPNYHPMQDAALVAIAALDGMPVIGNKIPSIIRRAAKGYVLGRLVRGNKGYFTGEKGSHSWPPNVV